MLEELSIDKFKQLKGFKQKLAPVTAFVGTNNSGKSSILQAVHSAVAIAQSRLRLTGYPLTGDSLNFTISPQDTLYLPLLDISWLATYGRLTQTSGPLISFTFDDTAKSVGKIRILRGKNRNLAVRFEGREVISRIEQMGEPFSIYVPGLAGIAKAEAFMAYGSLLRTIARGDANLVLRNVLYALKQKKEQWTAFLNSLNQVYPNRSINIRFNPSSDEFIEVSVKQNEQEIPLDCIGTGFLQAVQILSYIYLFNPAVTLLDEPDSHLHPNNQRTLGNLLWTIANEGKTQILLATHSRHLLDVLKDREKTDVLWMRQGIVHPAKTNLDILTDIGALDSAEGLAAQGVNFVVLTEDKNKKPISLLFEANGAQKGKFQVWAYKGCSKLDLAEALGKFIHEVSPQTKIIVHRDADFMSDADKQYWQQQFQRNQFDLFLTPTPDVEGVLCRLNHLKTLNPGLESAVEHAFSQALAEGEEELRRSAHKGREQIDDIRHKLGLATEGKVAIKNWADTLDLADERWRHGKLLLARIRKLFQDATGQTLKSESTSNYLVLPELMNWITATKRPVNPTHQPTSVPSSAPLIEILPANEQQLPPRAMGALPQPIPGELSDPQSPIIPSAPSIHQEAQILKPSSLTHPNPLAPS